MLMNSKGQIFSLDFIISLIAVIFAFVLLTQSAELVSYNTKEDQVLQRIRLVGNTAGELLVTNNESTCELVNASSGLIISGYRHISNCIDTTKLNLISKQSLGVPDEFACNIYSPTDLSFPGVIGCASVVPTDRAVFNVSRQVWLSSGNVSKYNFDSCYKGVGCTFADNEVVVQVWLQ